MFIVLEDLGVKDFIVLLNKFFINKLKVFFYLLYLFILCFLKCM